MDDCKSDNVRGLGQQTDPQGTEINGDAGIRGKICGAGREMMKVECSHSESCRYLFLTPSGVTDSSISKMSYGL